MRDFGQRFGRIFEWLHPETVVQARYFGEITGTIIEVDQLGIREHISRCLVHGLPQVSSSRRRVFLSQRTERSNVGSHARLRRCGVFGSIS